jgi:2-methylcitrate dehydratase
MVRWVDFSDTYLAIQATHPSDDVGTALMVADYVSRANIAAARLPLTMRAVLEAMIKAHEIQGVLALDCSITESGLDHPLLAQVACAAVAAKLLGGDREQIAAAVSLAFFDASLCVHRFGSNTGPRKGWAAADATSHAVRLALMAVKGEPGYPQVLTHPQWGFEKTWLGGKPLWQGAAFGTTVIENVIYKIQGPVVIHAQSALECALKLHPAVRDRLDDIAAINLRTHNQVMRKINKPGPLRNAADRDHCVQYAVAIALMKGSLGSHDYEDDVAADPRIDRLRALMSVTEEPRYTEAYKDRARGANSNAIEVRFKDGSTTGWVEVEYPVGHPRRRAEAVSLQRAKFERALARFNAGQRERIVAACTDTAGLSRMPVPAFVDLLANNQQG